MKFLKPIIFCAIVICILVLIFNIVLSSMGYNSWSDVIDVLPFSKGFTNFTSIFTGMKYSSYTVLKSSIFIDLIKFVLIVLLSAVLDIGIEVAFRNFETISLNPIIFVVKIGIKLIALSMVIMYISNLVSKVNFSLFNYLGGSFWGLVVRYLVVIIVSALILGLIFLIFYTLKKVDKNGRIVANILLFLIKSFIKVVVLIFMFILVCTIFVNSDLIAGGILIFIVIVGIVMMLDAIFK